MNGNLEQKLDECIELLRKGQSVEEIVASYPHEAQQLRPLLTIARDLQSLPSPALSSKVMMRAFIKASERQTATIESRQRKVGFFSRGFMTRTAAALLIVFLGSWLTINASADAMPGDWLYPIKRFTERAKFVLTINREDKAELRIVFSSERLKEAVKQHQRTGRIDQALLDEMLREARLAAETSEKLPGVSRTLLVSQTAQLSEYQQQMLSSLKGNVPSEQRKVFTRYAQMCGQRAQWMRKMCGWGTVKDSARPQGSGGQNPSKQGKQNCQDQQNMCPMWKQ